MTNKLISYAKVSFQVERVNDNFERIFVDIKQRMKEDLKRLEN